MYRLVMMSLVYLLLALASAFSTVDAIRLNVSPKNKGRPNGGSSSTSHVGGESRFRLNSQPEHEHEHEQTNSAWYAQPPAKRERERSANDDVDAGQVQDEELEELDAQLRQKPAQSELDEQLRQTETPSQTGSESDTSSVGDDAEIDAAADNEMLEHRMFSLQARLAQ